MISSQRHLFNIPADVAYFNTAYFSPQLRVVSDAGLDGVRRKEQPWKIGPRHFFEESERVRKAFADLIEASADDIAFVPSVSYGIGMAAAFVDIKAGDEIIVLQDQFPSNYYPWVELARAKAARVVTVARPSDFNWTQALLDKINQRTAVVALEPVQWTDGCIVDLVALSKRAREVGAALVMDASQMAGAMPLSVKSIQPDFLVSICYKWLMGPYSLGFAFVHPKYQQSRPLELNWLNRRNSEDFAGLVNYRDEFQPGARRFDVGERSNFALMPMAAAALEQVRQWGPQNIHASLASMTEKLAEQLQEFGLAIIPKQQRAGHILGARFPKGLPDGISQRLAEENVFVSIRGNAMRIAPHLHVCDHDLEKLIAVLKTAL
jgi:selenocysteine lyase/cysteine desulfurase